MAPHAKQAPEAAPEVKAPDVKQMVQDLITEVASLPSLDGAGLSEVLERLAQIRDAL